MGFFGSVGKFVAREHGHMAGTSWIKGGARVTSRQWVHLRHRLCPKCGAGRLFPVELQSEQGPRRFVGCSNSECDHYESARPENDPETISRLRALAGQRLAVPGAREAGVRHYRVQSRVLFAFALACLIGAIWRLVADPHSATYFNIAVIGIFVTSKALAASYRCWQLKYNRLFEPGLFKVWFKSGDWFV